MNKPGLIVTDRDGMLLRNDKNVLDYTIRIVS